MSAKEILIQKSIAESINGDELSNYKLLLKAITPYSTKVDTCDGKTYIWIPVPSGKWGWRIFNKKIHGHLVSVTQTPKPKKVLTEDEEELKAILGDDETTEEKLDDGADVQTGLIFPDKVSDLKIIKTLQGSTNPVLVEDEKGNKFVMKKGNSDEHIREEYLTNKIYELLGVPVPKTFLYTEPGQRTVMLSEYLPGVEAVGGSYTKTLNNPTEDVRDEVKKHFVADAFLANWDMYQNDNMMFDNTTNQFVRLDNGGGLRKRAQGSDKKYSGNIMDDISSMKKYNNPLVGDISQQEVFSQMTDIFSKKDLVLDFIDNSDDDSKAPLDGLKKILKERFDSIEKKLSEQPIIATDISKIFENNKSDYAELSDTQMDDVYNNVVAPHRIYHINSNSSGWAVLAAIGKIRNFDNKPTLVTEKDFDTLLGDKNTILCHRGVPSEEFYDQFTNSDTCFYGAVGVYGAGIYSTINEKKQMPTQGNIPACVYEAKGYGEYIKDMLVMKDNFKTVSTRDLDKMMSEEFYGKAYKDAQQAVTDGIQKITDLEKSILDRIKAVKEEISYKYLGSITPTDTAKDFLSKAYAYSEYPEYRRMGHVGNAFSEAESIDVDNGFNAVKDKIKDYIESIGGEAIKKYDDHWIMKLPNSSKTYELTKDTARKSIKQKSIKLPKYNFHYENFFSWAEKEHFKGMLPDKKNALKNDKKIRSLKDDIDVQKILNKRLEDDAEKVRVNGANNLHPLLKSICNDGGRESRGFYAMLKGYDAMVEPSGNDGTPYMIILNRSKLIVKQKQKKNVI